ncbi:Glu/Leu/Phe/Val dehydrogenase dimerization domain-containing protein [Actinokineospora spheciospongiae]|uniref:Glu/Leu/Phe/Val dehydrogenase dimerization domain-containing protein n=1 Tax=Actinokineospora spheciospongiae TaxID=909613 RepID=UPI001F304ECD|nr:Glu/Leu/Phe/Val dehydrogenase dimerization domain-containing protein [Actinokineospora spheciospongiae]
MSRTDLASTLDRAGVEHEELHVVRGARSNIPIVVAVHSTTRGPAIGGCRIKAYRSVGDGVADALRLSRAMTLKCGLAELPHGGGKTVVVLGDPPLTPPVRENLVLDIAETIGGLGGRYRTGPDIGTTPQDMAVIHRLTPGWAFCRPEALGGSGNSSAATARGVRAALDAAVARVHGARAVTGLRIGVIGYGSVGRLLGRSLAADGADVVVADRDDRLRAQVEADGLTWTASDLLRQDVDILVPAATGGLLSPETVAGCTIPLIVGPANNQLTGDEVATLLHERAITWIPDTVASAGGIIHAVCREELACDEPETDARIDAIGARVDRLLAHARTHGTTPLQAAHALATRHPQATA